MKKFNLFAILFAIVSVMFFAGCDNDNDKKDGDTNPPAEECKCDDGTACPEAGKEACVKPEADKCNPACPEGKECKCVEDACDCADVNPVCDSACKEDEDCIMGDSGKPECRAKDTKPEACKCDDGTDCPDGDKAKCQANVPEDKCAGKAAGDECDTDKVCTADADGKLACADKPAAPENPCDGKAAGDACGENKTCQTEADALVCKDTPAPSQPDPAE